MFHFFTDVDALGKQDAVDAFGPVAGAASTKFRVTSIHRPLAGTSPNVYAVCEGLLLVQDAGNNLVNLILHPTEPPPLGFPRIKYFVYRGVKRSSLVSGNKVALATNNDLTQYAWAEQQKRNARMGTTYDAPPEALGLGITGGGSADEIFYPDNGNIQLATVRPGWSLGEFDSTEFGFEIMVESVGFDPHLPLLRTTDNVVSVPALPASATQAQEFEHWHDKEEILNYVDPCAFFGCFYLHALTLKRADGSVSTPRGHNVYDEVLKGAHLTAPNEGVFFNRQRTYLDIRNEFNHSLNYFKNYGTTYSNTDIMCAFKKGGALAAKNYYANQWPLMFVENSDLPPNNASSKNIIRLSLPDGAGDNPFPTLYISSGYLADLYPREPVEKQKLVDLDVVGGFTKEVVLAVPNHADQNATRAVSSYIKLKYCKRAHPTAALPPFSSGTVIRNRSFFDNLFAPFDLKIPLTGPGKVYSTIYDTEVFVDMTRVAGYDYVGSVGVFDDGTNYNFIINPKIVRTLNGKKASVLHLSGEKYSKATDVWSLAASKMKNKTVRRSSLEFPGMAPVQYVKIVDEKNEPEPYEDPFLGFIILTCKKSSLDAINKSVFWDKSPIYLGAHNLARYADELGQEYWNFNISLNGFELSNGTIQFKEVVTNISIYVNGDYDKGDNIQVGAEEDSVIASSLPSVPIQPPIKHVFVLMLENRSFDHMLGFSGISGTDAVTHQPTSINGADTSMTNPFNNLNYPAQTPADFQVEEADYGPPHEFLDALLQLCATGSTQYDPNTGEFPAPDNLGFIYSYDHGSFESANERASANPEKIMDCFAPQQVPVLVELAKQYAVCDNWFSSLPGPTWPNRFFVHAATSGGLVDSPATPNIVATAGPLPVKGYDFEHGDIYDRLGERGMDWRVYEDSRPQVTALKGMTKVAMLNHYRDRLGFLLEVMNEDFAPFYCFIEPNHGSIWDGNEHMYIGGTSQHPRDDVRAGEVLITWVYEVIRNSPHWNNSVLVITYDEHGGFWDHVKPPVAKHPPGDENKYQGYHKFDFRRLGVRVPAVIVSPLIPKGTIDHTLYDHSSVLATLERMFKLDPLTERDRHANDFRHLFQLNVPRATHAEAPKFLPDPPDTFPGAAGSQNYRGRGTPHLVPLPYVQPPGATPIKDPLYRPFKKPSERDLEILLAADPTLHLPTSLSGTPSLDLLAWLHVAFRRRLAVRDEDDYAAREVVLREYCAVTTDLEAEAFIAFAEQEVDAFRAAHPVTTGPTGSGPVV